jgi:ribosomal protein S18 acetylase RimI-like enzyme
VSQASSRSEVGGDRGSDAVQSMKSPGGPSWPEGFQRTGRFTVVEDLSAVGCDAVLSLLQTHGLIGLFGLTPDDVVRVEVALQPVAGSVRYRQWALFHRQLHPDGTAVSGNSLEGGTSGPVVHPLAASLRWLNASQTDAARRAQACELMALCGVDPPEDAMLQAGSGGEFMCAVDGAGEVVAAGTILPVHHPRGPWAGHAQLGTLAVQPTWRRTGLALEMSERLIAAVSARPDITGLTAVAPDDNPASQALLMRLGFMRDPLRQCRMYFRDGLTPTR